MRIEFTSLILRVKLPCLGLFEQIKWENSGFVYIGSFPVFECLGAFISMCNLRDVHPFPIVSLRLRNPNKRNAAYIFEHAVFLPHQCILCSLLVRSQRSYCSRPPI